MTKGPIQLTAPRMGTAQLDDVAVCLHPSDHVAVAKVPLGPGLVLQSRSDKVAVRQIVPAGHKIALRPIETGCAVRRYGQIIGFASQQIRSGDHVPACPLRYAFQLR